MTINSVYVVDDEQFDRMLYKRVISKSGLVDHLEVFADAEDALDALRATDHPPDLILLDINMPRINGFDFLEAKDAELVASSPGISVAIMTTSENPRDRERADTFKSVKWFLCKPLTRDHLAAVAQEIGH